jgi:hypothetical protein
VRGSPPCHSHRRPPPGGSFLGAASFPPRPPTNGGRAASALRASTREEFGGPMQDSIVGFSVLQMIYCLLFRRVISLIFLVPQQKHELSHSTDGCWTVVTAAPAT